MLMYNMLCPLQVLQHIESIVGGLACDLFDTRYDLCTDIPIVRSRVYGHQVATSNLFLYWNTPIPTIEALFVRCTMK